MMRILFVWKYALLATVCTWGVTALGAAAVLFIKKPTAKMKAVSLSFSAGVMLAASVWSLIEPAMEGAQTLGLPPAPIVVISILLGFLFLFATDKLTERYAKKLEPAQMLFLSVTLHNFPEGLAVGVAFGAAAALHTGDPGADSTSVYAGALSLAIGIALQNFPEGAAVSLPLAQNGLSRGRAFFFGQASALVEPLGGVLGALLAAQMQAVMPFALGIAAGAMLLVCFRELIPESHTEKSYLPTISGVLGFCVMMALDNML
jgi:ZIP family zinc transporter